MAPLSLLDCPKEVQLGITELLLQADAANLSMTCRALHNLAERHVYSTIQITWSRQYYPPIPQILRLIRTLLDRRDLGNIVRSIEFGGNGFIDYDDPPWPGETPEPPELPSLPLEKLAAHIQRFGVSEPSVDEWMSKVLYSDAYRYLDFDDNHDLGVIQKTQSATCDAAAATVVSLLPSLERLSVTDNWYNKARLLGLVLRVAFCGTNRDSTGNSLPTFAALKYVSAEPNIYDNTNLNPNKVDEDLCLFYLPCIQYLSTGVQNPTRFSWPCASAPNPVSLTSLELFRLREIHLGHILSATKNLKKLRYNWFYRSDMDKDISKDIVMLDTMANALLEVKDSLEELEINAETHPAIATGEYEPPDVEFLGSMKKLHGMHKLKSLYILWSFITGMKGSSTGPGLIGAAMPPNIEHLNLCGQLMWSQEEEYELDHDETIIEAFTRELERGALSHLNSLKSISLPQSVYRDGMPEACEDKMRALGYRFRLAISSPRRKIEDF
ncbi:hypothetical protein FGLOB1_4610 [Fusarium globosum]|uniref:F-box domain-containing protein n=1 Tax=Fusarium globosum TaxID=78864 RepID=A0A8H5YIT9_9HYPO|nr:hypothetical protein FGLOB1_4610 [Fusarium globosum]